jgi:hypothetical protein
LQQFKAYRIGVRMPQQIAYSPEELKALLNRIDFRSIEIQSERCEIVFTKAEAWWDFQLTLGSRLTILGMDEETRARFKDEYLAKLRPMFRQDGLHLSLAVLYALAQR